MELNQFHCLATLFYIDRTEQSSSATASTDTTEVNGEERATKVIEEIQKGEDSKTMSKGLDNQGND